jgi:hypothetical protein
MPVYHFMLAEMTDSMTRSALSDERSTQTIPLYTFQWPPFFPWNVVGLYATHTSLLQYV